MTLPNSTSTMDANIKAIQTPSPSHQLRTMTAFGNSAANDEVSDSPPGSPRSASVSLQVAATMNAGLQNERSRRSSSGSTNHRSQPSPSAGRRRSVVLMNLHLNDPTIPSPGEMINDHGSGLRTSGPQSMAGSPILTARDPHHRRAPSLGGLHQEMEEEQEAHVNRILKMIRKEQEEARHLKESPKSNTTSTDDNIPASVPDRSNPSDIKKATRSPNGSFNHQKRSSGTPSGTTSPGRRPTSVRMDSGDWAQQQMRDDVALLQAERLTLIRENQMLKRRVTELEDEITEITSKPPGLSHSPSHHSHLVRSQSTATDDETTKGAGE